MALKARDVYKVKAPKRRRKSVLRGAESICPGTFWANPQSLSTPSGSNRWSRSNVWHVVLENSVTETTRRPDCGDGIGSAAAEPKFRGMTIAPNKLIGGRLGSFACLGGQRKLLLPTFDTYISSANGESSNGRRRILLHHIITSAGCSGFVSMMSKPDTMPIRVPATTAASSQITCYYSLLTAMRRAQLGPADPVPSSYGYHTVLYRTIAAIVKKCELQPGHCPFECKLGCVRIMG